MSFQNARFNESNGIQLDRPFAQWRRGDLTSQDERLSKGCWQLTEEQWGAIVGKKIDLVNCVHSGGVVLPSYVLGTIHVNVLAYQKLWWIQDGDQTRYLSKGEYQAGARGKFRIFGLIKELVALGYDQPAVITSSGLNSKALGDAVLVHKNSVVAAASKIAKRAMPLYSFWLPIGAGEKQATRNGQYVTPPEPKLGAITQELLESLYIGQDLIDIAEQYFAEAQEWAKPPQPVASDNGRPEEPPEEAFPVAINGQVVEEII